MRRPATIMPSELQLPVKEATWPRCFPLRQAMARPLRWGPARQERGPLLLSARQYPSCTIEACRFRDQLRISKRASIVVLGDRADSRPPYVRFTTQCRLPFVLLADEDKAIAIAYGAWGEKSFLGRKYIWESYHFPYWPGRAHSENLAQGQAPKARRRSARRHRKRIVNARVRTRDSILSYPKRANVSFIGANLEQMNRAG